MQTDRASILRPAFAVRSRPACCRDALEQIPAGVGLVSGSGGAGRFVVTALSVAPLSAEPPSLIVCLDRGRAQGRLAGLRHLGISILAAQHALLAERFLGDAGADLATDGVSGLTLAEGIDVIEDAVLAVRCSVEEMIERHDRVIVIARIDAWRSRTAASALVAWGGQYEGIGWTDAEIASATGQRLRS